MLRCGNIVLLTRRVLDVTKLTNLTRLLSLILCKLSFPIVDLKDFLYCTIYNVKIVIRCLMCLCCGTDVCCFRKDSDTDLTQRVVDTTKVDSVDEDNTYAVFVTYVEVYNNAVYDLLEDMPEDTVRSR
jgi:hypothetical protein